MSVLVVGAGPAGLATARVLQANGVDYLQVERHSGVGGLWDIDNPGSPMYEFAFDARIAADWPDLSGGIHFVHSPRRMGYADSTALKKAYSQALQRTGWTLPTAKPQHLAMSQAMK